jgi:hypothetical protein
LKADSVERLPSQIKRQGNPYMKTHINWAHLLAGAICATALSGAASGQTLDRPAAGMVVSTHQERLYVIPGNKAIVAGYFTQIAALPGTLFAGVPGESTAMFSFSFEAPVAMQIANGDLSTVVLASGGSFNIYYDPNPNRTWDDPSSFTTGTLVATYRNSIGTSATAGPVNLTQEASVFESSSDFDFQGRTWNFRYLLPYGFVTAGVVQGTQNFGPVAGYPIVFALSGSHVALSSK